MTKLTEQFGLPPEDLNIDLGPLGTPLPETRTRARRPAAPATPRLPPVPATSPRALADPQQEAEQPDDQDRERYPPQDVDGEAESAQYQGQEQDEQDDAHV
jgi:hypothetical protein